MTSFTSLRSIQNLSRAAAGLLVIASAILLHAQSYYGVLRGTILDPNGGSIAGAIATLVNEGTSEQRSVVSATAGDFVFSEVVPATYSVVVESPGFKRFERRGVAVGTQQQVALDLKLSIGTALRGNEELG